MSFFNSFNINMPLQGVPFPGYMPLPLLQAAVNEAQNNVKAPMPLIFSGALAAIAVASQGLVDVCKPTGQRVPTSLMLLSIANSGERKSTAENVFLGPIRTFQKEQNIIYQNALSEWVARHHVWETKKKAILKSISKMTSSGVLSEEEEQRLFDHENHRPAKPKKFKLLYDDSTSEALFSGLNKSLPTAGLISSEGGGVLSGRALNDLSKQNAIWSGDSITVDRASAESYEINGARLTVSIMAQESAFKDYMDRRGEVSRGSGLWARFLVCNPRSTQGTRFIENGTMSWEYRDKFSARLVEILQKNIALLENPGREKQVIYFSSEASGRWLEIFNAIESEIRQDGYFSGAGDHASKLADNIARVAALFHFFEGGGGDISISTLNSAVDVCHWYSDEFIKLFMPQPVEQVDAFELNSWLQNYRVGKGRYIRKNHIRQYSLNKLRGDDRLGRALEVLRLQGVISFMKIGKTVYVDLMPSLPPDGYAQLVIMQPNKSLL